MVPRKQKASPRAFPKAAPGITTPFFQLKFTPNRLGYNRFGVIAGLRVHKRSTARHLWKRRILAAARNWPSRGLDFLVIASPKITTLSYRVLKDELENAFEKARRA